jgi:competence protein ComEC
MLLTGDVEKATEFDLIRDCHGLQAELLKVAHHGSDTSSTAGFLDCVNPQYAVISGSNSQTSNRPSLKVIARIKERGAQLFTTYREGAIHAIISPNELKLLPYQTSTINP